MGDRDRTATRKIRLYLPIEEERLGPVTRTHVKNDGFNIRQKSYALKRSMKLSVCKVCYDIIDIDGFDDVINMNIDYTNVFQFLNSMAIPSQLYELR
jgi:hypothetical protein